MDRQLKQRLVGASVVVALAVIIVPELVKQKPPQGEIERANSLSEIPPRPVITEQAVQSAGQSTMIILPGGQAVQQPEAIGSDSGVGLADSADTAEPDDIVLPAGSGEDITDIAAAEFPAGPDDIAADSVFGPASESTSESTSEPDSGPAPSARSPARSEPARSEPTRSEPAPQRLPPDKPIVTAKRTEPKPATPPKPAPVAPAPSARAAAPVPAPARATTGSTSPPLELPAIELISRSQYAAAGNRSQQVSKQPRWMVQAGSFYVAENASMLREKLRQQRFPASLQSAVVDGRTVYRVQVGPHATRAEGERTQARLLREAGINGNIVPVYN